MRNISKAAEPSVFIFGTYLRVGNGHHILEGVCLTLPSSLEQRDPNQNLAVQICHRSVGHPVACDACQALYSCKDNIMQFLVYCLLALVSFS